MGNWLKEKIKSFAANIVSNMKEALGIHSPSRVFRDEVGKYMALGVGEGFENDISKVYKQMKTAVDFETQKLSTNLTAKANLQVAKEQPKTITNNNDKGINVTQNFYDKQATPYEQQKQSKQQLRRLAYGL